MARTAGWIAHAIEQLQQAALSVRARAMSVRRPGAAPARTVCEF